MKILSLIILASTFGCVSRKPAPPILRTLEQHQFLKESLATNSFEQCDSSKTTWDLPVPVKSIQINNTGSKPSAIYEGIFRDSIKAVWQPLDNKFVMDGDGITLGQKEDKFVTNFKSVVTPEGNTWTHYRTRPHTKQAFGATVEFLKNKTTQLIHLRIPDLTSESVQRIWLLPVTPLSAMVIVRTNSTELESSVEDEAENSTYSLYEANAATKKILKKSSYIRRGNAMDISDFVLKNGEPYALGVKKVSVREKRKKSFQNVYRLIVSGVFRSGAETVTAFEAPLPYSGLITHQAKDAVYVGWMNESEQSSHPVIHWIKGSKDAVFKPNDLRKLKANYFVSNLRFGEVFPGDSSQLEISWWANIENDVALVAANANDPRASTVGLVPNSPTGNLLGYFRSPKEKLLLIAEKKTTTKPEPTKVKVCRF